MTIKKTIEELLKPEPFIAWLATQPPEKEYNYNDRAMCPVSKYLKQNGYENPYTCTASVKVDGDYHDLPHEVDAIARYNFDELSWWGTRTYGGALNAARKWQRALATN